MFSITSSDVTLRRLKIKGPQFATQSLQYGVKIAGASAASPVRNVSVLECEITDFAFFGIHAQHCRNFVFDNNNMENFAYAAIMTLSCVGGSIDKNRVRNVIKAS